MVLTIVRHGPAGDRAAWAKTGKDDGLRPLTPGGRAKTEKAAKGLKRLVKGLDLLAASPLARARQTADLVAERYPKAKRVERAELAPAQGPDKAVAWLGTLDEAARAAVVGHEPHLSLLAGLLLTGRKQALFELKKAGAAVLEFDGPCRPGAGRLAALLPPKALRRLAD